MTPVSPTMRERACSAAADLFFADPRVALVLSEISLPLFEAPLREDPARAINVGIMEQTMVGVAAGFALEGFHPIVHTIGSFLVERPLEMLKLDFGYQELGATFLSVGASYDYSVEGTTHHSPADVAIVSTIPGFEALVPGTAEEAEFLLRATYANGRPTYLRTSLRENPESFDVEPGRIEVVRRAAGRMPAATLIAVGPALGPALEAAEGMDLTVLYATSVLPFDAGTVRREAGGHVVVVEPLLEGTLAPRVAEALADRGVRLTSIGVPRTNLRGYGTPADIDRTAGMDVAGIRARLRAALSS
jgi:transketolase